MIRNDFWLLSRFKMFQNDPKSFKTQKSSFWKFSSHRHQSISEVFVLKFWSVAKGCIFGTFQLFHRSNSQIFETSKAFHLHIWHHLFHHHLRPFAPQNTFWFLLWWPKLKQRQAFHREFGLRSREADPLWKRPAMVAAASKHLQQFF